MRADESNRLWSESFLLKNPCLKTEELLSRFFSLEDLGYYFYCNSFHYNFKINMDGSCIKEFVGGCSGCWECDIFIDDNMHLFIALLSTYVYAMGRFMNLF